MAVDDGYEQTAFIAADATRLAASCDFELSASSPELGPMFGPDLIMFNGLGDESDDFIYPPNPAADPAAGNSGNRGKCKTECRDYDTLVSAILLSVKHHVGSKGSVRSTGYLGSAGWCAAFELYSGTFPDREIPWPDNWPKRSREDG